MRLLAGPGWPLCHQGLGRAQDSRGALPLRRRHSGVSAVSRCPEPPPRPQPAINTGTGGFGGAGGQPAAARDFHPETVGPAVPFTAE